MASASKNRSGNNEQDGGRGGGAGDKWESGWNKRSEVRWRSKCWD